MTLAEYKSAIDERLDALWPGEDGTVAEPMKYSLLAGGKRLRPALLLEFCRLCGGDIASAMPAALAVEMFHTYTLIHDDLPCMDDDDTRRGLPTCHVKFGEAEAVLAADALQAEAFYMILSCPLPADIRAECARLLSVAAGKRGVCRGQYLDIGAVGELPGEPELLEICRYKTGSLIEAACEMGAVCAGAGESERRAAVEYGRSLGLAFQMRDDMLDVISTADVMGKNVHRDECLDKPTFASILGLEETARRIDALTDMAAAALLAVFPARDAAFLTELALALSRRES